MHLVHFKLCLPFSKKTTTANNMGMRGRVYTGIRGILGEITELTYCECRIPSYRTYRSGIEPVHTEKCPNPRYWSGVYPYLGYIWGGIPIFPKCRVPVPRSYRTYLIVGSGYRDRTELTEGSGTGTEFVPNLTEVPGTDNEAAPYLPKCQKLESMQYRTIPKGRVPVSKPYGRKHPIANKNGTLSCPAGVLAMLVFRVSRSGEESYVESTPMRPMGRLLFETNPARGTT